MLEKRRNGQQLSSSDALIHRDASTSRPIIPMGEEKISRKILRINFPQRNLFFLRPSSEVGKDKIIKDNKKERDSRQIVPTPILDGSSSVIKVNKRESMSLGEADIPLREVTKKIEVEHTGEGDQQRDTGNDKDKEPLLDIVYKTLKARENSAPNPEEVITLLGVKKAEVGLEPGQPEYEVLLANGVDKESLIRGKVKRSDLLAAGYVFRNKMGTGEKSLISDVFEDPENPGVELDFSNRVLLTQEELRKVYTYQLAHPDIYGLHSENIDEVRKDMLSFLYDATYVPETRSEKFFFQEALPTDESRSAGFIGKNERDFSAFNRFWNDRSDSDIKAKMQSDWSESLDSIINNNDRDWKAITCYWNDQITAYKQAYPNTQENDAVILDKLQQGFAEIFCGDIYTYPKINPYERERRRHMVRTMNSQIRKGKLSGIPSPFLESGFVFTDNPDIEVFLHHPSGKNSSRRLNMVNIHLLGGHPDFQGLNEMGGSRDQVYMPAGEYLDEFFIHDRSLREADHDAKSSTLQRTPFREIILQFQEKLISIAHEWADAQPEERSALICLSNRKLIVVD